MKIIDKIFRDKKNMGVIYILLVAGIMLVVFGSGQSQKKQENKTEEKAVTMAPSLEEELEKTLCEIKGAGNVTVMLTYENNGEKKFGYDTSGKEKKTVILNKQGSQEALVSTEKEAVVRGVIIIADGGGNIKVRESLIKATQTVLSLAPHKIEVFERNEGYDDGN